jgi:hypothetical protein
MASQARSTGSVRHPQLTTRISTRSCCRDSAVSLASQRRITLTTKTPNTSRKPIVTLNRYTTEGPVSRARKHPWVNTTNLLHTRPPGPPKRIKLENNHLYAKSDLTLRQHQTNVHFELGKLNVSNEPGEFSPNSNPFDCIFLSTKQRLAKPSSDRPDDIMDIFLLRLLHDHGSCV